MFRKTTSILHRWLGFTAGLVLFLSLLPASIYVFEKELTNWYHHDLIHVGHSTHKKILLSELLPIAQNAFGKSKPIGEIEIKNEKETSYIFIAYHERQYSGLTFFTQYDYWEQAYVDPYTGKVLGK